MVRTPIAEVKPFDGGIAALVPRYNVHGLTDGRARGSGHLYPFAARCRHRGVVDRVARGMRPCRRIERARALYRDRLRPPLRFRPLWRGTFAPSRRASLRPIAIACLRLLTRLPDRPDFNVPCLRSCIARFTLLCAFFPYFALRTNLREWRACKADAG